MKKILAIAILATAAVAQAGPFGGGGHRPGGGGFHNQNPGPNRSEHVVIDMKDIEYRADMRADTVRLKQLLQQRRPDIRPESYDLKSVTVHAKSRLGGGEIALIVGGVRTDARGLTGNPNDFYRPDWRTFGRIDLFNRVNDDQATWQLSVRGNVIIRQIELDLSLERQGPRPPMPPPPRPPTPVNRTVIIGQDDISKNSDDTDSYNVDLRNVQEVSLEITSSSVDIKGVVVQFGNGETLSLFQLNGRYVAGQIRRANLNGRNIVKVSITGNSISKKADYVLRAVIR